MTRQQQWFVGVTVSAALSLGTIAVGTARAARIDYESHKVENAKDAATTAQALADVSRRLQRIESLLDDRLPPKR